MDTKKAIFLNAYLTTCILAFNDVLHLEPLGKYKIDGLSLDYKDSDFKNYYGDFLNELELVILESKDLSLAHVYLETHFNDVLHWDGFQRDQNKIIFSNAHEVNFLITLKRNIEKYTNLIKGFSQTDRFGNLMELSVFFNATLDARISLHEGKTPKLPPITVEKVEPVLDLRFDYVSLKVECD